MNRDRNDELNELGLTEQERSRMEQLLSDFRQTANDEATRPELFWASMRTRVAAEIRKPQSYRGLGWAATLAAVSAMVMVMSVPSHKTQPVAPTPTAQQHTPKTQLSDEELLQSIAETTNSDVPDALAPATVLTSEMDRGLTDGKNNSRGRNNQ